MDNMDWTSFTLILLVLLSQAETVYCWTGAHDINPRQWMSQVGMCESCYAQTQTVETEHDTEPMPAIRIGDSETCAVFGCLRPLASPVRRCARCHKPMCRIHGQDAECPACAGGK